ncbi:hypothetical protein [Candidatus Nitrosotenuis sp. DW1]|uniref:hypothetical protein n=1 Tax=Candidatus Nitrosotenuis sp. DW1 TaxID=2259672 RepID=UPI0015C995F4|nr:hypothetical protein [Candidatus Nitrosotenuis sp. DW1]
MTSRQEINKIMRDVKKYKQTTDREIKLLNMKIVKLQKMIEKNMMREDSPDEYEIKAIKNFESKRKQSTCR